MKVPMKWLRDFVDPGIPAADLAHRLTMAGLEAEKITQIGEMWGDKVYVGHVNSVERHPDADRLVLANVSAGEHRLTVVTGAPNIAAGQNVVLALAGARLYDGHSDSPTPEIKTLKPGKIRGIESQGMVCSEKELGLSEEHEGILVLPGDAPEGMPFIEYAGDTVIEFEITPNLAHAFSILGIAREVRAILDRQMNLPPVFDLSSIPAAPQSVITIDDPVRCGRYVVLLIEDVTVGPSPEWLVRRLEAAGMRSINNMVDMTNYVMHEFGFPMHAFDCDRLNESRIIVRAARAGETLETLDHVERALTTDMSVIADASGPVGLAGIMGGFDAEVSDDTTRILLEVAHFDPTITRATSRSLKLRTEASARYERGIDLDGLPLAVARAAEVVRMLNPHSRFVGLADAHPVQLEPVTVEFEFDRIERLLGMRIEEDEVLAIQTRLDFDAAISGGRLVVNVPSYRKDVRQRQDVIEEIARVAGYDRLPTTLPSGATQSVNRDPAYRLRKAARATLTGAGYSEAITYVTIDEQDIERFSDGAVTGVVVDSHTEWLIKLKNALQSDRNIMRPTLLPSMLDSLNENLRHTDSVRLFEIARAYVPTEQTLPNEVELIGLVAAGKRDPFGIDRSADEIDFFEMKGVIESALESLGFPSITTHPWLHKAFHPGRAAEMRVDDQIVARFGEMHPHTASQYGIDDVRVIAGEINLGLVLALHQPRGRDVKVPHFLPVRQDFAVVVQDSVPAGDVEAAFRSAAGPLLTDIHLFDVYAGSQIGEGKISMAWRLEFTAPDRTLTDNDLIKIRPKIEKVLKQRVEGTLRA